jgi:hypothetical protein
MTALMECDLAAGDIALNHNYIFAVNDHYLEVEADNDLLAYARVIEQFPREQAVLLSKTAA